jgi:hypothetical protein
MEMKVEPFHPVERTALANDVCNVRKCKLTLGMWHRKKLREPMIEPSVRDFTHSHLGFCVYTGRARTAAWSTSLTS